MDQMISITFESFTQTISKNKTTEVVLQEKVGALEAQMPILSKPTLSIKWS
jgi:hypothetical protein